MSEATKAMRDFLTKSPNVVFPDEVMELFIPVERENAELRDTTYAWRMVDHLSSENVKLRELVQGLWFALLYLGASPSGATGRGFARQMRELGIEVKV